MKTFFSARLRSHRFSRRPVFYGLLALLLIIFPTDPAAGPATPRASLVRLARQVRLFFDVSRYMRSN